MKQGVIFQQSGAFDLKLTDASESKPQEKETLPEVIRERVARNSPDRIQGFSRGGGKDFDTKHFKVSNIVIYMLRASFDDPNKVSEYYYFFHYLFSRKNSSTLPNGENGNSVGPYVEATISDSDSAVIFFNNSQQLRWSCKTNDGVMINEYVIDANIYDNAATLGFGLTGSQYFVC
ncbi:hypothetical protein [Ascidiaceihabitans sp.]|uniref:hypothetical protein n=1 Tax=Ascidiaceihabitans sp. TaxID=1872644 RepID=UPI0032986CAE